MNSKSRQSNMHLFGGRSGYTSLVQRYKLLQRNSHANVSLSKVFYHTNLYFDLPRGVQKQFLQGNPIFADETIQGILEEALSQLRKKPLNVPLVYPASRTDQGVHALCTAAHVDLEFPDGRPLSINGIISSLNKFCVSRGHEIRILNMQIVPSTFSARYSVAKKNYLYRFAVIKPDVLTHIPLKSALIPLPIIEKDRCYFIHRPGFNSALAQEATELFIGNKDFKAFMGKPRQRDFVKTERSIEELTLTRGNPLIETPESDYYDFWNVSCTGKSFLFRQVRRMVGALIAVGQERVSYSHVKNMFVNPTYDTWDGRMFVVPAYGLYLANIFYKEEDLLCEVDSKQEAAGNYLI